MIARLDNEVFFKKAFTDPFVLKAFVKDIVGIDVDPDRIETEKSFQPKLGNIDLSIAILRKGPSPARSQVLAEDTKRRVIIEIQKVEYDHNFDRFLHYHLQGIVEQQRSSEDYTVGRTVYTIVVMTAPYRANAKTGEIQQDEVLISTINPKNLRGIERHLFNHELIFLNPNYRDSDTPPNYRDWLDLIYDSIHSPENPQVNVMNEGVMRAAEIIQFENISPEEWERSKIEVGKRKVLELEREEGKLEGLIEGQQKGLIEGQQKGLIEGENAAKRAIARKMREMGLAEDAILLATGLDAADLGER